MEVLTIYTVKIKGGGITTVVATSKKKALKKQPGKIKYTN